MNTEDLIETVRSLDDDQCRIETDEMEVEVQHLYTEYVPFNNAGHGDDGELAVHFEIANDERVVNNDVPGYSVTLLANETGAGEWNEVSIVSFGYVEGEDGEAEEEWFDMGTIETIDIIEG